MTHKIANRRWRLAVSLKPSPEELVGTEPPCLKKVSTMLLLLQIITCSALIIDSNGLSETNHHSTKSSSAPSTKWHPLPHHHHNWDRRKMLLSTSAGIASSALPSSLKKASATTTATIGERSAITLSSSSPRVASVNSHPVIPVWPSWAGGRVVPVSLTSDEEDPFLLLAHHKHWFDPHDPLRGPFKEFGSALGLPYIDVEGFALHPHRGLDILTYVLDGSDGFRHKDSLGGSRTYRGGCAQWMRTGAGVMHEEFWETRDDRRTNIELFQIWINLPSKQKLDPPAIQYVGSSTDSPWIEKTFSGSGVKVRDVTGTLHSRNGNDDGYRGQVVIKERPPIEIRHVSIPPDTVWEKLIPKSHSTLVYVREGSATLDDGATVKALQSATFQPDTENGTNPKYSSQAIVRSFVAFWSTPTRTSSNGRTNCYEYRTRNI